MANPKKIQDPSPADLLQSGYSSEPIYDDRFTQEEYDEPDDVQSEIVEENSNSVAGGTGKNETPSTAVQNATAVAEPAANTTTPVGDGTSKYHTQEAPAVEETPKPVAGGTSKIQTQNGGSAVTNAGTQPVVQNTAGSNTENLNMPYPEIEAQLQKDYAEAIAAEEEKNKWENPTLQHLRNSGLSYGDYMAKAREMGYNPNALQVLNQFYGKDPTKSIEENEKAEKKAKNKEKMDAIGNALYHLGNWVGAVAGKGHASVPLENPEEYTKRQQALKDKTQALRQKTWQDYYQQLKDQRADDNAKATQAYRDRKAAQDAKDKEELYKLRAEEAARKEAKDKAEKELKERKQTFNETEAEKKDEREQQRTDAYVYGQQHKGGRTGSRGGGGKVDKTEHTVTVTDPSTGTKTTDKSTTYGSKKSTAKTSAVSGLGINK